MDGYYDAEMNKCLCSNVPSDPYAYCDAACQAQALKAYITTDGRILLSTSDPPEENGQYYDKSEFDSLFLDGLTCEAEEGRCLLQNVDTGAGMGGKYEAPKPFVEKWQEDHPEYTSPYAEDDTETAARRLREGRALQAEGGGAAIPSAIIVVRPGEAVSFETTAEHFPVYLKDSSYNTNPNFDDGVFDTLKTKITASGIAIASFAYTFVQEGVYVFGDYADPGRSQTIVIVSPDLTPVIEPLTAENL